MNLQPTLENELIILKPLVEDDFVALYAVAKDPLIWEQHYKWDRYKREVFEHFFKDAIDSKGAFLVEDKSTGEVIGSSRYKLVAGTSRAVEIGWTFLSRSKWGGHYNRSMKKLMIDHAFKYKDFVVLYITQDNLRSQKAASKIGAVKVDSPEWSFLMKKADNYFTFMISKETWSSK